MIKIYSIAIASIVMLVCSSHFSIDSTSGRKPTNDYVPNAETAVKVAEAIWLPIYGENIYECRPFVATLTKKNVWIVVGTLTKDMLGGTPYIEIQKSDCRILKVTHGK